MISVNTMIKQLDGLIDTVDLSEWENGFVKSIVERTQCGRETRALTDKQLETLERIHGKHFA